MSEGYSHWHDDVPIGRDYDRAGHTGGLVEVTDAVAGRDLAGLSDAQMEELRASGVVRAYVTREPDSSGSRLPYAWDADGVPYPVADDNA